MRLSMKENTCLKSNLFRLKEHVHNMFYSILVLFISLSMEQLEKSPSKHDYDTKIQDIISQKFEDTQRYKSEIGLLVQNTKKIVFHLFKVVQQSILSTHEKAQVSELWDSFSNVYLQINPEVTRYNEFGKLFFEEWGKFRQESENIIIESSRDNQLLSFYTNQLKTAQKYTKLLAKSSIPKQTSQKPIDSQKTGKPNATAKQQPDPAFEAADQQFEACLAAINESGKNLRKLNEPLNKVNKILTTKIKAVLTSEMSTNSITKQQFQFTVESVKRIILSYKKLLDERKDHFVLQDQFEQTENQLTECFSSSKEVLSQERIKFKRKQEEKIVKTREKQIEEQTPKKQLPKYYKVNVDNLYRDEDDEQIVLKPKNKNKKIRNSPRNSPRLSKERFENVEPPVEENEEKQSNDSTPQVNEPIEENEEKQSNDSDPSNNEPIEENKDKQSNDSAPSNNEPESQNSSDNE